VTPVSTVALLFWVALVASALCLVGDGRLRVMLKAHWKTLAVLLALTLLWRIPADGVFFHGLEYEDSYIYTVAGRQMAEHVGPTSIAVDSPYSINACAVGSLKACQQWELFPEHLIGYPYVVSIVSRVLGYTPSVGSFVNLLGSCITTLLVFCIALLISDDPNVASLGGALFAITPVFAVYGLETSAEPFSNVCIALVVWLYLRLCDSDQLGRRGQVVTWIAYSAALLFAQTIKREDILLAAIMPIMLPSMLQAGKLGRRERYTVGALVIVTSALTLILSVKMRLLQTSSNEVELARQFPITPRHLAAFVIGFLRSFSVSGWYGGTVFAVVAGAIVACRRRGRALLALVLLTAYIVLYASHIRSYYEMKSGLVEPQAALRFSMNFMALWATVASLGIGSIVTGIGRSRIWNKHRQLSNWCAGTVAALTLVVAFIATVRLRAYEVEDETISRLDPASSAMHVASHVGGQSDFIATMEPLVVQMYADSTTRVVDLESVDPDTLQTLISTGGDSHVIFLKETDRLSDDDLSRYGEQVRYLLSLPSSILQSSDRFQVLSIDNSDSR
jgi:Dolichyl-phosphate-mannose-protein mannosyltransferase